MKKEVEDLLVLVNLSNMDKQTPRSSESEHLEGHYSNETDYHDTTSNTYNEHINHNNEHINYNNEHINYNRHNTDNPPTVPPLSRIPDRTTWL